MKGAIRSGAATLLLLLLASCATSPQQLADDGYDVRVVEAVAVALKDESPTQALMLVDEIGIENVNPRQQKTLAKKLSRGSWAQLSILTALIEEMTATEDSSEWPLNRSILGASNVAIYLFRRLGSDDADLESSEKALALERALEKKEDELAFLAAEMYFACKRDDPTGCITGYPIRLERLAKNKTFVEKLEKYDEILKAIRKVDSLLTDAPPADVYAAMSSDPVMRHIMARFHLVGDGSVNFANPVDHQATYAGYDTPTSEEADARRPYSIYIFVGAVGVKRELLGKRKARSQFVSGTRSVQNPRYLHLQHEIQRTNAEINSYSQAAASGSGSGGGSSFMSGMASGMAAGARARLQSLLRELQETPMFVEQNVLEEYEVEYLEVALTSARNIETVIVDRRNGLAVSGRTLVEDRVFEQFPQGLHEKDVRITSRGTVDDRVKSFRNQPPTLSLDELISSVDASGPSRPAREILAAAKQRVDKAVVMKDSLGANDRGMEYAKSATVGAIPGAASVVVIRDGMRTVGAGVFIARNLVVTNAHVIEGLSMTIIEDASGATGSAQVMRINHAQDLALLKVDIAGEPVLFARSVDLKVGSDVYAVGHPSGLKFSVSKGSISAIRELRDEIGSPYVVVQTDASINPGNSGGPLLIGGKLAGINTFKLTQSEGLGFAVHVDEVEDFVR